MYDSHRRLFLKSLMLGAGSAALHPVLTESTAQAAEQQGLPQAVVPENMLGEYGPWAKKMLGDGPAKLSFLRDEFSRAGIGAWREKARARLLDCMAMPDSGGIPKAEVMNRVEFDGLSIEHLRWQLPYGPPTEAMFLKPAGAKGRLPAILALHDHSGKKYFGHRKISRSSSEVDPLVRQHVDDNYGGVWWANEMARRGYAVLAPDAFLFGSRRVRLPHVPRILSGLLVEGNPENANDIVAYNRWAAQHEHVVAKSLLCAGTTVPGVVVGEDQRALDYLCSRDDVDASHVGCCGLSSGGLRTLYLAGLDDRIAAACCVGMMTTWRDFCLNKSYTHTWMIYPPGLPRDLDYPEILGLRVPLPTLVQNAEHDQLYTMPEMKRADRMLSDVYKKAGVESHYQSAFYPGTHRFDLKMQAEAFTWLDTWLAKK
jgi:dienelactone hydrolase